VENSSAFSEMTISSRVNVRYLVLLHFQEKGLEMECKCVALADERTHFAKTSLRYKPQSGVDNANAQDRVSILSLK
jgi:hypothetical protein